MEITLITDIGKAALFTILVFLVFSVVIFTLTQFNHMKKSLAITEDAVIVFITAHPDDECMFFGPAVLQTVRQKSKNVHVLCLTTGNFYNKGPIRRKELYESCKVLGVPASNVDVLNNSSFLDGNDEWDFSILLAELLSYTKRVKPDYIFTFDSYGVSGHPNHISTSKAIRQMYKTLQTKDKIPTIFELESVPLYRKYISLLDVPISFVSSQLVFVSSPSDILKAQLNKIEHSSISAAQVHDKHVRRKAYDVVENPSHPMFNKFNLLPSGRRFEGIRRAMCVHKSQLVWFRWLYILFSRYMIINTFNDVTTDLSPKHS